MRVKAFDHLVLNVRDVERALAFYSGTLGLEEERVAEWRAGRAPFPSVRVNESTIIDLVDRPRGESNVDHICLAVDSVDWQQVIDSGVFTVLEGPVARFGARGEAQSLYVQDPDGNTVELRWYPQDAER
ncbi:VOC family protein [Nonomuraea dietziae]|uniref:Catechol 2,3-dioxygenase-like lactoylglutathione lyase family enzyme n=1 Tax=Nonomuraea dietziae TaxID=65515 RepID=A0A7W5V7P0_9ACTN|nr:VOC family protein [Nonomuraea dietziae]MBB3727498.1 catechol 2,3-dioxygenase-like lactoylglutathione lyase family enzyme [Nonomuraea dietziae]